MPLTPAEEQELAALEAKLAGRALPPSLTGPSGDEFERINQEMQTWLGPKPRGRSVLANLVRGGGTMLGSPLGLPGIMGAGALSEAAAQKIEGRDLDPGHIAVAGALPGGLGVLSRLGRGVGAAGMAQARRGGLAPNLYDRGLKAGGSVPVEAGPLREAATELTQRAGTPPTPTATGRLLRNVEGRPWGEGPTTWPAHGAPTLPLREVENLRRVAGEASTVPGSRIAGKRLVGASKSTVEGAAKAGVPGARDLDRATTEERARAALLGSPRLREVLLTLGLGGTGMMAGGPGGAAAGLALPRLWRLLRGTRPAPGLEAFLGGAGNIAAGRQE